MTLPTIAEPNPTPTIPVAVLSGEIVLSWDLFVNELEFE
jgi:hypothetical protein